MIKRLLEIYRQNNTRTPLTSQVEAIYIPPNENINNIIEEADLESQTKNVTFQLSPNHIDRDNT